ncbi:MAG: hypothetical protein PWP04_1089 [Candidatus Atribacteria bacterium]|nr:hypothetical protein [Candidatus Atribacteria bacterium]
METWIRNVKLKLQLANLEREKEKKLLELGREAFALFQKGEAINDGLRGIYQEILSLEEEIEDLLEKARQAQGARPRVTCSSCGAYIERDAQYCPYCGSRQKQSARTCSNCGKSVSSQGKFCPYCGTNLEEGDSVDD